MGNLELLVKNLRELPRETSWLEFKEGNYDGEMIGQRICGLANAAALEDRAAAYLVWGVRDNTHELVGVAENFSAASYKGQELENWLRQRLSRNADFRCDRVLVDGAAVDVLTISPANGYPVAFCHVEYIRIGSITRKMEEFKELSSRLWNKLRNGRWEDRIAKADLDPAAAVDALDVQKFFSLKGLPFPSERKGVLHYLSEDGLLVHLDNGLYGITNLGAVLFARNLNAFRGVSRKALRVVRYADRSRMSIEKHEAVEGGYASEFESAVLLIEAIAPGAEPIINGVRRVDSAYPPIAVRELLANTLIHQDFTEEGAGPALEIFPDRMEFSNPGVPLVEIDRIIDTTPKSRNEHLASLMRQFGLCEELGTGWDKIVIACEINNLPPPKLVRYENGTRVILYAKRPFSSWSGEEKLRACYFHACIRFIQGDYLTNKSLRDRFGVAESSAGSVSRLIAQCVQERKLKPLDPQAGNRYMKYVPYWA